MRPGAFLRGGGLILGAWLVMAAADPVSQPKPFSPAEAAQKGRELVAEILARRPAQSFTNTGTMRIRDGKGRRTEFPVEAIVLDLDGTWEAHYQAQLTNRIALRSFTVIHAGTQPNLYWLDRPNPAPGQTNDRVRLTGNETMVPFAGSDFWIADLGLEFFHWPEQRLLKYEMRRSRSCRILESINPHPAPGAYSRVVSWIDLESDGIVCAEAYDFNGKLLKEFAPKDFKKVNGQWQVQEIRIDNDQTGSRTWIDFDVGSD
jgi:hypothetical protein